MFARHGNVTLRLSIYLIFSMLSRQKFADRIFDAEYLYR